jgi:hypothetical protein
MKPEVRQWHIVVTDSTGEAYQITDSYLVGIFSELTRAVELAVEQWEAQTGLFAERIELESHGKGVS